MTNSNNLRYFFITWAANTEQGQRMMGTSTIVTEDEFLNSKRFQESVREEAMENGVNLEFITMTFFKEVSESDYLDWIR